MKQQRPATIANGRLVTPDGLREGTLRLVDGMIYAFQQQVRARVCARVCVCVCARARVCV